MIDFRKTLWLGDFQNTIDLESGIGEIDGRYCMGGIVLFNFGIAFCLSLKSQGLWVYQIPVTSAPTRFFLSIGKHMPEQEVSTDHTHLQ
jgi:hypothetical protein